MEDFLCFIADLIVPAILSRLTRFVRNRRARGRVAQGGARTAAIPARVMGVIPSYPGYWRAGEISLAAGTWRPRGPWGTPVSFAGAARPPDVQPHEGMLPAFASKDTVLALIDHRGTPFQIAVHPDEAELTLATIARAASATPSPSTPVQFRGLRNRVPLIAFALLAASLAWLLCFLLALTGATTEQEVTDGLALALVPLIFPLIMAGVLVLRAWDDSRTLRKACEPTPSELAQNSF